MFKRFWLLKLNLAFLKELFGKVSYLIFLVRWQLHHVRLWVINLMERNFDHVWLKLFKRWLWWSWHVAHFQELLPIPLVEHFVITPETLAIWIEQRLCLLICVEQWVFEVNLVRNHRLIDSLVSLSTFICHYYSRRKLIFGSTFIWYKNVFRNIGQQAWSWEIWLNNFTFNLFAFYNLF